MSADRLMMLYVAVWRSNRWPYLSTKHGVKIFIGTSKKLVKEAVEKVDPKLLKLIRVVKYVPAEYS
jgi:hypothetical protein